MKGQRVFALFKKNLKMVFREPANLFLIILFPVVLTLAFGAAFGATNTGNGSQTYTIGVVNSDGSQWSKLFVGNISEVEAFNVKSYGTNDSAQVDLQQGRLSAVVNIPADFGASIDSYFANPATPSKWTNTTVGISVDQASLVAKSAIPPTVQQAIVTTMFGKTAGSFANPISTGDPSLVAATQITEFDYMVPGLFVYGVIFLVMTVASPIVEDRQKGLLKRISVTPTSASEVLFSHFASNAVMGEIQVALIFAMAFLMGFHSTATPTAFAFSLVIIAVFALVNVGFGLIVASIAKTSGAATGLSFLFILPQMFLGTFVPAPQAVAMFVPSYYVTDSLASLFLRGAPITSPVIWMDFGVVCAWCVGMVALGVLVYRKFGKV